MVKNDISDNSLLLESKIRELSNELESVTNPEEVEKVSKLIKKNVPFFKRAYFSAFLFLELQKKSSFNKRDGQKKDTNKVQSVKKSYDQNQTKNDVKKEYTVPEGAKTLYLNIGKMRHLYGKDLSKLLQQELGITREDIYVLRVHDKYTFVTMSEENCEKAISKLNGKDINGRKAEFSYSTR